MFNKEYPKLLCRLARIWLICTQKITSQYSSQTAVPLSFKEEEENVRFLQQQQICEIQFTSFFGQVTDGPMGAYFSRIRKFVLDSDSSFN